MCQRVQKIDGVVEANGRAKFSGTTKPSTLATPIARCEYPAKSKNTCKP